MAKRHDKPLIWLKGEVKTPPFSAPARLETGLLALPHSRPMAAIGKQCHELRISDPNQIWRIVYHVANDAIVILDVFKKKTQTTPAQFLELSRKRLAAYLRAAAEKE